MRLEPLAFGAFVAVVGMKAMDELVEVGAFQRFLGSRWACRVTHPPPPRFSSAIPPLTVVWNRLVHLVPECIGVIDASAFAIATLDVPVNEVASFSATLY